MPSGVEPLGVEPIAGSLSRSTPSATVTSPSGTITSTPATVVWSYSSPTSRDQHRFRVRYLTLSGDELYASGTLYVEDVAGVSTSAGSFEVPYVLPTGSFQMELTVGDSTDWSLPVLSQFSVELPTAATTALVETVGSVFDVAIDGVGYVLADRLPDRPVRRTTASLQAPRFATGDTSFNQAIDRYSFSTYTSWRGGAGQRLLNRDGSNPSRFHRSEGVDPFSDEHGLKLLPKSVQGVAKFATAPASLHVAVAGTKLVFVSTADGSTPSSFDVYNSSPPSGFSDSFGDVGTGGCIGLASDGLNVYAAIGDDIHKYDGSSWAAFGSAYTGSTPTDIAWCSDRLAFAYTNSSGEGVLSTVGPAGSEEVAGGRFKFPDATVTGICGGDGYLWFGVNRGREGTVYAWQLGSSDSSFVAMELPTDQVVERMFFYLGNVIIGARDSNDNVSVYRALSQSGALTPELVLELRDQPDGRIDFTSRGSLVFFTWTGMSEAGTQPGVGALDLTTGGHCSWLQPAGSSYDSGTTVGWGSFAVANYQEGLVFTVTDGDDGITYYESPTETVDEGWIEFSTDDSGSGLRKVYDLVEVRTDPLGHADDSVAVEVSTNGGVSFTSVGDVSGAGATSAQLTAGLTGSSVTVKLTLSASSGGGPTVRVSQVKLHPLTISDEVVELPLDLGPNRVGLNGRPLQVDRRPLELLRVLQSLVGSRVRFQDVDWPTTREAGVWELVGVDATSAGSFNRHRGARVEHDAVASVTLRRGA